MKKLKKVGFFSDLEFGDASEPELKDRLGSEIDHKTNVVNYLKSGEALYVAASFSYDIMDPEQLICTKAVLSDGEWAWPADLGYYLEKYDVILPTDFIQSVKSKNWKVPMFDLESVTL